MTESTFSLTNVHAKSPEPLLVYKTPELTVIRYCNRSRCVFSSAVRSSIRFSSSSCVL